MPIASEPELTMVRVFDAPRERVFRVWTDPRYVARWWGVAGCTLPVCELDVRLGGAWRIDMRVPSGVVYRNGGVYLEVVANERIVYTDVPDPESPVWAGSPPEPAVHTVTFEDVTGGTRVTLLSRFRSIADRDRRVSSGVQRVIALCLDRVERILQTEGEEP